MSITSNGIMTFTNIIRRHSPSEAPVTSCLLHEMFGTVSGHLLLLALIYSAIGNAEGAFVQTPTDAIVMVNDSTIFNCSSNDTSTKLTWYHYAAVGKGSNDVYDDKIKPSYEGRFDIASDTYNLLVQRPESNDAGKYECKEDPLETGTSAELTILDSELRCEANRVFHEAVGLMHCGQVIDSEESLLLCSVDYRGNIAPRMTWNINETESNKTKCDNRDKRAVCNATVDANLIRDGSVFTCQITTAEQYTCALKVSKTTNTVRNITAMNETSCFANISDELQCEFKWTMDNNTVHTGTKLKTNKTGQYKCEIECIIRNKTCGFIAMEVNVLEAGGGDQSTRGSLFILTVVLAVLLSVALIIVVAIVIWMKRQNLEAIIARLAARGKEKPTELKGLTPIQKPTDETDAGAQLLPKQSAETENETCSAKNITPSAADEHLGQSSQQSTQAVPFASENTEQAAATDVKPEDKTYSYDTIEEATFKKNDYIHRGLCGEIHGPIHYRYNNFVYKCMYERIMWKSKKAEEEIEVCKNGQTWKNLNHSNLINIYDVVHTSPPIYIVMEYAKDSIRDALDHYGDLEVPATELVRDWSSQIACGLQYLHGQKIVHKSITSDQIFIVESPEKEKTIKLSSFKFMIDDPQHNTRSTNEQSAVSPPDKEITAKYDVWSYGMVVWEMLTKSKPYTGIAMTSHEITTDICDGATGLEIPKLWPRELRNIIAGCRVANPSRRIPISNIITQLNQLEERQRRLLHETILTSDT